MDFVENGIKTYGCYGVDSSIMRLEKDYERFPEVKQLMESQMERIARPFWDKRKEEIPKDTALKLHLSTFSHCEFFWNGGGCFVRNGDNLIHRVYFKLERNPKYKEEMDAKKPEDFIVESRCRSRQIHKGNRISRLFRKSRSRTRNKK
ncbi:IgG-binding virulence factor TspB family protein [Neisseria gonorrhoeae]|uniref:IgG-binding virulence factor TspB family protein n=1 Tax=Neisseria gonorrhoeae TaxID=485 RepID=UPI0037C79F24